MQNIDVVEGFMRQAFRLAKKACGRTSPNPMVGAILVRDGKIVGKGYHKKAGEPHAEINAINDAGDLSKGADLYINLEPCSHYGRTPPCADAVIKAGIKKAFIAMKDPNPEVAGSGIERLQEAGIEVETEILENEALMLNEAFIKHITTGMPFVTLKAASSLDGRIATKTGDSKWITGEAARLHVHKMRDHVDAIMVGIGTVEMDDPSLSTRLPNKKGRNPVRVIVDEDLRISLSARVINPESKDSLIIATTEMAPAQKIVELERMGAKILVFKAINKRVPLKDLMKELGKIGITSLLIEGGSEIHASALSEGIADKLAIFYAPKIIGGVSSIPVVGGKGADLLSDAIELDPLTTRKFGCDILIEGYIKGAKAKRV
ncbi:MAG: bifunctional diaminohydroxyphosphoribosylaminopyrimidine deaminase/5-amino-6-(5-phosphoribosylamino)uracil reductase RibD [bacterium]|nr:bifunctional diaminohydroxyphosphoribosylaminopyrimidine deaminase/5-amino-6-(5-phosphoribosylamino)uracil reductase RibD [bacterium]